MTAPRSSVRSTARRRRRRTAAIGAAGLVLVAVAVAAITTFGGDDGSPRAADVPHAAKSAPTRGAAATPSTPAPTTAAADAGGRRYAVGTRSLTFVDPSRSTSPNGLFAGAASRTLPTSFWYPAPGAPGGDPVADARPDAKDGPFPLVLFAHGYDVTPDFYAPLLERWAAAGYVVAAPTYPILSGSDGGASHVDYEQTFGDTSFVITQVLGLPVSDPLAGLVDPDRIAAAGHSDGEVVSFGLGFLECCRDPRVRSVIAMAGNLANANNPSVRDTGTPILHIMELHDEYDPYADSIQWDRDNLTAPRWMVSLDSSHVPPYTQPGDPAFELVSTVTVDFLDGTLGRGANRLDDLARDVANAPGVGTLER
jgi:hypothetical protein